MKNRSVKVIFLIDLSVSGGLRYFFEKKNHNWMKNPGMVENVIIRAETNLHYRSSGDKCKLLLLTGDFPNSLQLCHFSGSVPAKR